MEGDLFQLKSELLGSQGLISRVRSQVVPDSYGLAKRARKLAKERMISFTNPDQALSYLLSAEFEVYQTIENKIFQEFISRAYEISSEEKHPTFRNMVQRMQKMVNQDRIEIVDAVGQVSPVIKLLSESFSQSRKTRAGNSLAIHISNLFHEFGLRESIHFAHSKAISNLGRSLEFIFPAVDEQFSANVKIVAATKTTVNDGVRSLFTQFPGHTDNYILTASGSEVFGTRASIKNFVRQNVLKEGAKRGIKFVAIVEDDGLDLPDYVISYSTFFDKLKSLS